MFMAFLFTLNLIRESEVIRMTEAALKAKREYQKKWREKNPDKLKKYAESYWERQSKLIEVEVAEKEQYEID